jgi:hypothetical protein
MFAGAGALPFPLLRHVSTAGLSMPCMPHLGAQAGQAKPDGPIPMVMSEQLPGRQERAQSPLHV